MDYFGYKFNLKIKNQNSFKTLVGGIATTLMLSIFLILLVFKINQVNNQTQLIS